MRPGSRKDMLRQEVYCENCEGEFTIESTSMVPISFCPNCGAEVEPEEDDDEEDEWDDRWA